MPAARQILASDRTAAKLLDMTRAEFRSLVEAGALPPPVKLGNALQRWRVRDLEAIVTGDAAEQPLEW